MSLPLGVTGHDLGDAGLGAGGGWLVSDGAVGPMVVVVSHPYLELMLASFFAGVGGGVEDLAGHGLLIALDLAVVLGRVGLDPLVS